MNQKILYSKQGKKYRENLIFIKNGMKQERWKRSVADFSNNGLVLVLMTGTYEDKLTLDNRDLFQSELKREIQTFKKE